MTFDLHKNIKGVKKLITIFILIGLVIVLFFLIRFSISLNSENEAIVEKDIGKKRNNEIDLERKINRVPKKIINEHFSKKNIQVYSIKYTGDYTAMLHTNIAYIYVKYVDNRIYECDENYNEISPIQIQSQSKKNCENNTINPHVETKTKELQSNNSQKVSMDIKKELRCANCGLLNKEISINVNEPTKYSCYNCNNILIEINSNNTEDDIFLNTILHDEKVKKWLDATVKVHTFEKGDFCGDNRILWSLCREADNPNKGHYNVGIKLLELFDYKKEYLGNFYRWYAGITINEKGKVLNKSQFIRNFTIGQIANQVFPGASIALRIADFLSSDENTFEDDVIKYEKFYQEFKKTVPID